jgi:hypothetical protein
MNIPRRWLPVIAVIAIVLSIAALSPRETAAATCTGKSHTLVLSDGTVSPGSGSTDVRFAFTVTYADSNGCSPDRVVVMIVGIGEFALSYTGGDLEMGATFGRDLTLPAGSWSYSFEASSGSGAGRTTFTFTNVDPPVVLVVAPTPKPTATPTPKPTATPTPKPTRRPTPAPTATPRPSASASTPPPASASPPSVDPSPSLPASVASPAPATAALGAAGPGGSSRPGSGTGLPAGAVSPATALDDGNLPRPLLALLVSSVGTLGGLGLFAVLGAWLLDPRPRLDLGTTRRRGRDRHSAPLGSER